MKEGGSLAFSNLHEEWPRARRMWPEKEPQTHLPPCLAPSGKRVELSQTWRQNIIACCVGEQPVFIRAGDVPGGAGYSRLWWKGPLSFYRPTLSISGPGWLELCVLCNWWKPNLIASSLGCLSQVCRPAPASSFLWLSHSLYGCCSVADLPKLRLEQWGALGIHRTACCFFLCVHVQPAFLVALKKVQVLLSASSFHEKISGYCDL